MLVAMQRLINTVEVRRKLGSWKKVNTEVKKKEINIRTEREEEDFKEIKGREANGSKWTDGVGIEK